MLATVTAFADELRRAQVPVSLTETLDAERALGALGIANPTALRAALAASLVKDAAHRGAFDALFDVYFLGHRADRFGADEDAATFGLSSGEREPTAPVDAAMLEGRLRDALAGGEPASLAALARILVDRYAGIEPGRPVGASYYLARVLRSVDLDGVLVSLLENAALEADAGHDDRLARRFRREDLERAAAALRQALAAEITRRLVLERGVDAVAAAVRPTLLDDVDFMHASRAELVAMRRVLQPLARALAARLARKRRHRHHGALDFRATIRRSLSTGGVPIVARFRNPHRAKPELVVLADVSGSVAAFARFTLHLVHALASQFSAVRTFVFIDEVDEVTRIFRTSATIVEAVARVEQEASVCDTEGHSDYGSAFARFCERHLAALGPRTTVLVLGDGRGNYHPARPELLGEIARRAHRLYWLNPEPRSYWGSGDSVVEQYAPFCDRLLECRNLRQLTAFVDELA